MQAIGKLLGARNLAENLQKGIVRDHRSVIKQRQLSEKFKVAPATVFEIVKRNRLRGGLFNHYTPGQRRWTSHLVDRIAARTLDCRPSRLPRFCLKDVRFYPHYQSMVERASRYGAVSLLVASGINLFFLPKETICFVLSARGAGLLHRIREVMTTELYERILEDVMLHGARRNFGHGYVFQRKMTPSSHPSF